MGLLEWWRSQSDEGASMYLFMILAILFAGLFFAQTQQTKEFESKLYNYSIQNAYALCNFDPKFFENTNYTLNYSSVKYKWDNSSNSKT